MQREEKSERSRRQVLDAALQLFSHRGYRATSMRDIAHAARLSTGNVYHHFPDKESIFNTLLSELWAVIETRRFPYSRALAAGDFPDNLEHLASAARESISEFRSYVALIYVDMIEFDGTHAQKFYNEMPTKFADMLRRDGVFDRVAARLRPGVSPVSALMLTTRLFFSYFTIEILFNVPAPFGKESSQVVREVADILRNGMIA